MRVYYLGIDPGVSGGLASIGGSSSVELTPMPGTDQEIWDWVRKFSPPYGGIDVYVAIEKVGGWIGGNPKYQHSGQPGSAMFRFGASYGALKMAVTAAGYGVEPGRVIEVIPRTWQKALGIPPKGIKTKEEHKRLLCQRARELFPTTHITLKTCDALLLAHYCRLLVEDKI